MGHYDRLLALADEYGLRVIEMKFCSRAEALIKGNKIAVRRGITRKRKACAVAEEIGHYLRTVGDILDQADVQNRKQEMRARQWAYQCLIPLDQIVQAHKARVSGRFELAEYLGVTEEFLQSAIDRYTEKYGLYVKVDKRYTVQFEPLGVIESCE